MKACYPGTFDPITRGHINIIERASRMFEEVDVLIMVNPRKQCTFSEEERKDMIEQSIQNLTTKDRIRIMIGSGLTVDYADKIGAGAMIRGIRAISDYEYELQQATANLMLNDRIETLFFIARPEYSFLSSSVVKEIASNGGDVTELIPAEIHDEVIQKLQKRL
ncbi:MAG: pantetheine-phosphate adenylyltransferase [Erysipelotrichia bacterium]|nr:pantetheine-phosphate adenylyltransferase [Erysipelotrichia bacterium]